MTIRHRHVTTVRRAPDPAEQPNPRRWALIAAACLIAAVGVCALWAVWASPPSDRELIERCQRSRGTVQLDHRGDYHGCMIPFPTTP